MNETMVSVNKELVEIESKLGFNSDSSKDFVGKTKKAIAHLLFRDIGYAINKNQLAEESIFFSRYSIEDENAFATVEETIKKLKEFFNGYY